MNEKILADWDGDEEPEPFVLDPPRKSEWVCGGADILSNRHSFTDPNLVALLNKVKGWTMHWRRWVDANGSVQMDKPSFNAKVKLGDKTYSFGLGGLHSEDDPLVIEANDDARDHRHRRIKLLSGSGGRGAHRARSPRRDIFCGVFADLMATRLEAKAKKQKEIAQGMKIAINSGGYGKLSDRYSPFRDPPKGAAITINGQLILLRLIEGLLGIEGVRILSANTDGVLIHHPRRGDGADIPCDGAGARHLPAQQVRRDRGACGSAAPASMSTSCHIAIPIPARSRSRDAVQRSTTAQDRKSEQEDRQAHHQTGVD